MVRFFRHGDRKLALFNNSVEEDGILVDLVLTRSETKGRAPMHAPDFQTGIFAGLWGFIAAASSVLGRMQDGRGRSSRLSIFESSIAVTGYIMFESFSRGDIMRRIGVSGSFAAIGRCNTPLASSVEPNDGCGRGFGSG